MSYLLTNIGVLVTLDPELVSDSNPLGVIGDAALVIADGQIAWYGQRQAAPPCDERHDAAGGTVLPGWVDSHSHLVFGSDRAAEFAARMAGQPYAAGGIAVTVAATRSASGQALAHGIAGHLAQMYRGGTTTVETKTGYGLSIDAELRCAELARASGVDAVTFLGAHAVPPEYAHDADAYLDLVCGPMLAAVAPLVDFVDVFCETGAFDAEQTRRVLRSAAASGLAGKVHGNQLGHGPGVQVAVAEGAVSVDHCTYLDGADVAALAASDTVATLLPITDLCTRHGPAQARTLLDAGATVALASNCNPGSGYSSAMALAVALAVISCQMTVPEAITAATVGGAAALRRNDIGRLTVGMRADVQLLDAPSPDYLAYRPGMPLVVGTWRAGQRVF